MPVHTSTRLAHRAPSFRVIFLPMREERCRSQLRWSVLGHLVVVCGGLAAQQDLPFATGASFPTRETLLTIATETPFIPPRRVELPEQVDLSPWFPVAGDQGVRNSCTGWAVGYALRYYQEARRQPGPPVPASAGTADTFSPSFVYNCSKQYLMKGDCDQGSDLIVAMTVAVDNGVCRWSTLPYDTALTACQDSIPSHAFAEAAEHRMQDPKGLELHNTVQWKHHLLDGRPIAIALSIDQKLYDRGAAAHAAGRAFTWAGPDTLDPDLIINGHALVVGGYDDADSTFQVFNSWGTAWGRNGWFRIPYRVMSKWCYGAYVVGGVAPTVGPRAPCTPADKRAETGKRVRDGFRKGEFEEIEGLRLSCHEVSDDGCTITVLVECAADSTVAPRTLTFRRGQPVNFHLSDSRWTFKLRPPSLFARKSERRARFVLSKGDPAEDEHIQDVLERVQRCKNY